MIWLSAGREMSCGSTFRFSNSESCADAGAATAMIAVHPNAATFDVRTSVAERFERLAGRRDPRDSKTIIRRDRGPQPGTRSGGQSAYKPTYKPTYKPNFKPSFKQSFKQSYTSGPRDQRS